MVSMGFSLICQNKITKEAVKKAEKLPRLYQKIAQKVFAHEVPRKGKPEIKR